MSNTLDLPASSRPITKGTALLRPVTMGLARLTTMGGQVVTHFRPKERPAPLVRAIRVIHVVWFALWLLAAMGLGLSIAALGNQQFYLERTLGEQHKTQKDQHYRLVAGQGELDWEGRIDVVDTLVREQGLPIHPPIERTHGTSEVAKRLALPNQPVPVASPDPLRGRPRP